jgi:hypothetical protein
MPAMYSQVRAILWQNAMQKLTPEELHNLNDRKSSIAEVKQALDDALKSQEASQKKQSKTRNVFSKIVSPIKKFIAFADTIVSLDASGHTALPWAGLKFILQVKRSRSLDIL